MSNRDARDGVVLWMLLESQIAGVTVDAVEQQPLAAVRHCYELTDIDEKARLERRSIQLNAHAHPQ